jgi:hypothetical protein
MEEENTITTLCVGRPGPIMDELLAAWGADHISFFRPFRSSVSFIFVLYFSFSLI